MSIGGRHWLAAFTIAILVHGSLILLLWEPKQSGAANIGVGGLEVSFGMAGGAPGATEVSPPEQETVDAEVTDPLDTSPVETVEAIEVTDPVEVEAIEPPVAETVPVVKVKQKAKTARAPIKPPPPKEVKTVVPKPTPARSPPKEVASRQPSKKPSNTALSVAGSAGTSGTKKSTNTGSGKSSSAGGRPGSANGYFARLQAWLEQHKTYPSSARRRRREGTAVLNFTISRDGNVLEARILRGTGVSSLDDEVMKMIKRATPLPPFPDDFTETRLTLSVPVQFQLH